MIPTAKERVLAQSIATNRDLLRALCPDYEERAEPFRRVIRALLPECDDNALRAAVRLIEEMGPVTDASHLWVLAAAADELESTGQPSPPTEAGNDREDVGPAEQPRGPSGGGSGVLSPRRIQRKRTKGWRMPEGAVYVGRPTKWGNPYRVGPETRAAFAVSAAQRAVNQYRLLVSQMVERGRLDLEELRGKHLACWCPLDQPCHADVLLELANRSCP